MRKWIAAGVLFLLFYQQSLAQHADLGSGALKNQIWWFDWAGITIAEGASRTFTTDDGLKILVVFSHVTPHVPVPYVMNTYFGAVLHLLYDFSNTAVEPALYDPNSPTSFSYTMTVTATRGGIPVSFSFITADAEASDQHEITTLHTNGSNWQTIQFFRNSSQTSNPLTGCGSQTVTISNTFSGISQVGQNPVLTTLSPLAGGPLVVDAGFDHGGTTGGMALAFGVLQSVDRGDLPASYGTAQHQLLYSIANSCNYNPPYLLLSQSTQLMIGSIPGDADPIQYTDDNAIGVDEEGVAAFSVYDNSGSYSVNLTLGNTTGSDAYLTGWFDYNRDGVFSPGEAVTATIPNNATTATLTWTGLPTYLPKGTAQGYGFRFRISSDLAATKQSSGYAGDGEVEDYFVTSAALCTPLQAAISPLSPVCPGQPASLQATGGISYTWSPATDLSDPNIADPVATISSSGTYTVTASNPQGCEATASITILTKPIPTIGISNDTITCQGKPVSLTATGGISYTWTSSDHLINTTGPTITPAPVNSTEYYVLGTDINGCSATDSVHVTSHPIPVFAATPAHPDICLKDSVLLKASGGDQYAWTSGLGTPLGTTSSILVSPAGNNDYQVQITDDVCQSSATLTIPVTVKALPIIGISSSNDIDCTLGQATLRATGALSYQWANIPGLSSTNSPDPIVRPAQTTTYYVIGTDRNGCSSIDSITVSVDFTIDLSHYPVPSAFSPNNDGNNDCFGLKYWGRVSSLELTVFNRWGQRVFFTSDPQGCWDGTYKGTPQPAGGYVYQIRATTACGTAYRKGIVILVR
ncbi:MAG TPA: CshA/CshB family fibrillar adhesin-related protein [Puia sp.]|jgi:gliding motility-associated-like protein